MNKPITLCDRCKEYARCCLNYDGDNCRRSRTVEPTNADRIRSMSDEELAIWMAHKAICTRCPAKNIETANPCKGLYSGCKGNWLDWLRQESE